MTMTDRPLHSPLQRKLALEQHFANDFSSLAYCLLVDIYFQENDLVRAGKVCEIGLRHHPAHTPGLYFMALIAIREGRTAAAEEWLEKVLAKDARHVSAAELNVAVKERLKRPQAVLEQAYRRLLIANPMSRDARARLKRMEAERDLLRQVREELEQEFDRKAEAAPTAAPPTPAPKAAPEVEEAPAAGPGEDLREEKGALAKGEPDEEELAWEANIKKVAASLETEEQAEAAVKSGEPEEFESVQERELATAIEADSATEEQPRPPEEEPVAGDLETSVAEETLSTREVPTEPAPTEAAALEVTTPDEKLLEEEAVPDLSATEEEATEETVLKEEETLALEEDALADFVSEGTSAELEETDQDDVLESLAELDLTAASGESEALSEAAIPTESPAAGPGEGTPEEEEALIPEESFDDPGAEPGEKAAGDEGVGEEVLEVLADLDLAAIKEEESAAPEAPPAAGEGLVLESGEVNAALGQQPEETPPAEQAFVETWEGTTAAEEKGPDLSRLRPQGSEGPGKPVERARQDQAESRLGIDPKLATFTLATIYKVQGLYQQALQVLDLLETKGSDRERIESERASISRAMTSGYKPE